MQQVIPAILTPDPVELREGLKILRGHTNWVHIDIMDGKFVPTTSVNLFELGEAFQFFHLEIHLMVEHPEKYLEDCKSIGAKRVIFHVEAAPRPSEILQKMSEYGFQKTIAFNPTTSSSTVAPYREKLDNVLLMGVNPGSQGQLFIPEVLSKIPEIRKTKKDMLIGVDGGIHETNIQEVFRAGASYVIVGSAVMRSSDPGAALRNLQRLV